MFNRIKNIWKFGEVEITDEKKEQLEKVLEKKPERKLATIIDLTEKKDEFNESIDAI